MTFDRHRLEPLRGPTVALGSVIAVIALLLFIGHKPGAAPVGAAGAPGHHHVHDVADHRRATPPAPAVTSTAATRRPAPAPSRTGGGRSHARPATTAAVAAAPLPVTVLNNSRIQGLAASVADELQGRGWGVDTVGNYTGQLSETTLYYPPGELRAAQLLARQFQRISRIEPRPTGLPGSGLTLVLTRYWES